MSFTLTFPTLIWLAVAFYILVAGLQSLIVAITFGMNLYRQIWPITTPTPALPAPVATKPATPIK